MIVVRSLLFNIFFYIWTILMTFSAILGHVLGHRYTVWVAYTWGIGTHFLLKWIVGLDYEIRGKENLNDTPAIFACKHQSLLETSMIQVLAFDSGIILKRELLWIPFFGQALSALGVVGIARGKGKRAIEQLIKGALKCFKKGRNFMIYPEGTRMPIGATTKLKPGVVALYTHGHCPVIPIVLNTGHFWARRSFLRYPGKVVYQYLKPIEPGLSEKDFMEKLHQALEEGTHALDQETLTTLRPSRCSKSLIKKWGYFFLTLVFIGLAGGGYYTFKKSEIALEKALTRLQEKAKEKGFEVTYTSLQKKIRGFSYEVFLTDPALRVRLAPEIRLQNQGGLWVLSKNLLSFDGRVHLRSQGEMTLMSLQSETPLATLGSIQGYWEEKETQLSLNNLEGLGTNLRQLTLKQTYSQHTPRIQAKLLSLKLPGLPLVIDELLSDFLLPDPMLEGFQASDVKAWSEKGGTWDIGQLVIVLNPLRVALEGSLSLDESQQPLGSFTVQASGVEKGMQRLEKAQILPTWLATLFRFALSAHNQPKENETQEPIYRFSLTIQNGQVYLEGLPLFPLPEVKW